MLTALRQLLAPPTCSGCSAPGSPWCLDCAATARRPQRTTIGIVVHTDFEFAGPVRRTIIDWKDENLLDARRRVIAWFAAGLEPLLQAQPEAVVVPVPASLQSLRRRGAGVLHACVRASVPGATVEPWLVATRPRHDQAALSRAARHANLLGSMAWIGPTNRPFILVDDVLTTGATLREGVRAARSAGALPSIAFAIAHRERRDSVAGSPAGLRLPQDDNMGGFRGHQ